MERDGELEDVKRQLVETEKERDGFCQLVVELETNLLQLTSAEKPESTSPMERKGEREELERKITELERRNASEREEREALEAKCSEYRQRSGEQGQRIDELVQSNSRLQEDLEEVKEALCSLKSRFASEKTSLLAQKDADLVQLQKELADQMTECDALAESLRHAEQTNSQLRQELDAAHNTDGRELQEQRVLQLTRDKDEAMVLVSQMRSQLEKAREEMDEKHAENIRCRKALDEQSAAEKEEQEFCTHVMAVLDKLPASPSPGQVVAEAATAARESNLTSRPSAKEWTLLVELLLRLLSLEQERSRLQSRDVSGQLMSQIQTPTALACGAGVARTPSNMLINITTPVKSEGRWQELKNIQSGDKWYVCAGCCWKRVCVRVFAIVFCREQVCT